MTDFMTFIMSNDIYKYNEIEKVLKIVRTNFRFSRDKKIRYFNVPCSFDIETTSFRTRDDEKRAIMYEWTFGIYGLVIVGRTWSEFEYMLDSLCQILDLKYDKRLIVYVHNLSFEFQFIRKHFEWNTVFSLENRKPIYALCDNGIEFRCSYLLSGYGLEEIGKQLCTYPVRKMVGDLDYNLIRHADTPLTAAELQYCVNDVKVVMAYIAELIDRYGGIARIPLTKTGFVRNFCRKCCFDDTETDTHKRQKYGDVIHSLRLAPEEYTQLKRAFQGGFTHANPFYSGRVMQNVTSFDFTSSYPTVMVSEKFPMSSSENIDIKNKDEFEKNLRLYCCLFDVEIFNLQSKLFFESPLSVSRCWGVAKPLINNGRLVSADRLKTTLTEQDYNIIKTFYTWDGIRIYNFRRYRKDYLPTDFVKSILKLYCDKTTLKDVDGREAEYMNIKEMVNSCYGMTVTDIIRPEIVYDEGWKEPKTPDLVKAISNYNKQRGRFLFYPWGVWVTAYARRNLFTGICEFADDYVYSDTDSVKVINENRHIQYIQRYNDTISDMLRKAMQYHNLPYELTTPVTKNGEYKPLGVWDFDGNYSRFKTLGAKRYIVEYSTDRRNKAKNIGKISITVSGVNKEKTVPYLIDRYGKNGVFDAFCDKLQVPAKYTGKLTHTYIDERVTGEITDYMGNIGHYDELSGVHLEMSDYSLSLAHEYADYIAGVQFN